MNSSDQIVVISQAINQSGLSDKEISNRTNISVQNINRWRRGIGKSIRKENIRALGEALDGNFIFQGNGNIRFIPTNPNEDSGVNMESTRADHGNHPIDKGLKELLTDENIEKHGISSLEKYMLMRISSEAKMSANSNHYLSILYSFRSRQED